MSGPQYGKQEMTGPSDWKRGDIIRRANGTEYWYNGFAPDAGDVNLALEAMAKNTAPAHAALDRTSAALGQLIKEVEAADPWQHRGKNMRCSTCMWFAVKAGHIGRCRRHAPTLNGYPVVYKSDWCGDHKLNEAT